MREGAVTRIQGSPPVGGSPLGQRLHKPDDCLNLAIDQL